MTVLIVGGDKIDSFTRTLAQAGFSGFRHWNGRKAGDHHQIVPHDTRLILLVIDQVNHGMAARIRSEACTRNIPIIFSPRSKAYLSQQIMQVRPKLVAMA